MQDILSDSITCMPVDLRYYVKLIEPNLKIYIFPKIIFQGTGKLHKLEDL